MDYTIYNKIIFEYFEYMFVKYLPHLYSNIIISHLMWYKSFNLTNKGALWSPGETPAIILKIFLNNNQVFELRNMHFLHTRTQHMEYGYIEE